MVGQSLHCMRGLGLVLQGAVGAVYRMGVFWLVVKWA